MAKSSKVILHIFGLLAVHVFGQQSPANCKEIMDHVPYFARHTITESDDSLKHDFEILTECGRLDSVDGQIFNGPMLGVILFNSIDKTKRVTYGTILKDIEQYRHTSEYVKLRKGIITLNSISNKPATTAGFQRDKPMLIESGMNEPQLNKLQQFISDHESERLTYGQAFQKMSNSAPQNEKKESSKFEFRPLFTIEGAIDSAHNHHRRALIYFTGRACVNARKMEETVLQDERVIAMLSQKFNCFRAVVDDRTPDHSSNATRGEVLGKMQNEKFKTNYQPFFVILDNGGNSLAEIGYTGLPEEFIDFLKKGMD